MTCSRYNITMQSIFILSSLPFLQFLNPLFFVSPLFSQNFKFCNIYGIQISFQFRISCWFVFSPRNLISNDEHVGYTDNQPILSFNKPNFRNSTFSRPIQFCNEIETGNWLRLSHLRNFFKIILIFSFIHPANEAGVWIWEQHESIIHG